MSDAEPGISRRAAGKGFVYLDARGRPVRDAEVLARIGSLVIPPAWTDVWICARSDGHLQATGRDARGRKQYRYHQRWSALRDTEKFGHILQFAKALPGIRRRVARDLQKPALSRARVLATVVRLLETTLIRVGNDEYARTNGSYGLTTLEDRHVDVVGKRIVFSFRAKSGVKQRIDLEDPELARSVRRCRDLPGQRLFQYLDEEGRRQCIESGDVNAYLREVAAQDFTAKDFRTWAATVLAACALRQFAEETTVRGRKKAVVQAIDTVASKLGNTRAVCRKAYVHPAVLDAFMTGSTVEGALSVTGSPVSFSRLSPEEQAVLSFLGRMRPRQRQRKTPQPAAAAGSTVVASAAETAQGASA
ncbi:MAG: DNA topoisomerase IB [Vicinamibacterales bacterium]